MLVRSNHPYAYKSGQWAQIVAEVVSDERLVWLLVWPDGDTDEWAVEDPSAEYEFRFS